MRQFWTRATRPRLFLVVAVTALITLAVSSPITSAVGGSRVTGHTSAPSGAVAGDTSAKADCSKAAARQLVEQHHLNAFLLPNPVQQVLCGPFTGPGSEAMAVTIRAPTCWGIQRWAVFSFTGGVWQLVLDQSEFVFPPLVAVGPDIRETTPVFRPGDPRCIPSGGSHARIWHWNGKRLVAGPWKQVKPAAAPVPAPGTGAFKYGYFKTPSGNIQCDYGYGKGPAYVRCGIRSGLKPPPPSRGPGCDVPNRVVISQTGSASLAGLSACPGEDEGDAGPFAGGQPGGPPVSVIGYGKTWNGGGLSCTSAVTGLTCRNKSGHGFFLSRERWRLF
jgi:hypothetical protein